jgi:hypothetical protein
MDVKWSRDMREESYYCGMHTPPPRTKYAPAACFSLTSAFQSHGNTIFHTPSHPLPPLWLCLYNSIPFLYKEEEAGKAFDAAALTPGPLDLSPSHAHGIEIFACMRHALGRQQAS